MLVLYVFSLDVVYWAPPLEPVSVHYGSILVFLLLVEREEVLKAVLIRLRLSQAFAGSACPFD